MPTAMRKREGYKSGIVLLQGTLDMLNLQTLRRGFAGGCRQFISERSGWKQVSAAIIRRTNPSEGGDA